MGLFDIERRLVSKKRKARKVRSKLTNKELARLVAREVKKSLLGK